jgi:hypothetical protein
MALLTLFLDAIDDYFVQLDIVSRLIQIIEKCADLTVVNSCIGTLTWYKPKGTIIISTIIQHYKNS